MFLQANSNIGGSWEGASLLAPISPNPRPPRILIHSFQHKKNLKSRACSTTTESPGNPPQSSNSIFVITGGAFIAFEQMQNEEKDGSASATFWDLSYELLGGGIPSSSEYKALFAKHGFTDITITFTQEWNEVDIIYARKARK